MMILNRGYKLAQSAVFLLLVELLTLCSCSRADLSKEALPEVLVAADSLYEGGLYEQAAVMYGRAAESCEAAESLQSLCYYRAGVAYSDVEQWGKAIVHYRRALLLAPDYSEARHNLRLTEGARMSMPSMEYPIVRRWADAWAYACLMSGWLTVALVLFAGAVMSCLAFFFGRTRGVRRGAFYTMLVLLVLWGIAFVTILHRHHYDRQTDVAILCGVKASLYAVEDDPEVTTPMMELYDGAEMIVSVEDLGQPYLEVSLPDGTTGQIERDALEMVTQKEKRKSTTVDR